MDIKPPSQFSHAGQLTPQIDSFDPREERFDASQFIQIDLRDCEFVRLPAALWCVVSLALARKRGSQCRLIVPTNMGVCVHLKSIGFFDVLRDLGVEVDDRDIYGKNDPKIVLPITRFASVGEATTITNQVYEHLRTTNLGAVNLTTVVSELFSELALNAAQHSESSVGAFATILFQSSPRGQRFACMVADGGIGIRSHLSRNPNLLRRFAYDWDALELAIRERVSGTGDPHRGIGLYGVSEDVRRPEHSLLLHSGLGSLEITEDLESSARRTRLFPGTLVFLAIPG